MARHGIRTMEFFGALSNFSTQERLEKLSAMLAKIAASDAKRRPSARSDRLLRSGLVPDAIAQVLTESDSPMRACEIHIEVERVLGRQVPRSSVKNHLASRCGGDRALFVRLERGRYQLLT
jgi:hypothetical protein